MTENRPQKRYRLTLLLLVALALLMLVVPALAQDAGPVLPVGDQPIGVGEIKQGEISATLLAPRFIYEAATPQTIAVQVLGTTPNLFPTFRILDPDGITIASVSNTANQTIALVNANLTSSGRHIIEVQSVAGITGQFVITIQPGGAAPAPMPLTIGQQLTGNVGLPAPLQLYTFTASPQDVLLLTVRSELPSPGVVVVLKDATTNETLGVSNMRLIGVRYRVPAGLASYRVEVMHSGSSNVEPYLICLEPETASTGCGDPAPAPPLPIASPTPFATVTLAPPPTDSVPPSTGPCAVTPAGVAVNIRFGPSTDYAIIGSLGVGVNAQVIGRLSDNSWYQIQSGGVIGWVAAIVVTRTGDCSGVPLASPPPSPTPPPTATFTPTFTPSNTPEPTFTPSNTPTPTITNTPLDIFIPPVILVTLNPGVFDPPIFDPPGP